MRRFLTIVPVFLCFLTGRSGAAGTVEFTRDVQPILRNKCIGCHGAQQQLGGVRFDSKAAALAGGYSGVVIVAGNSANSRLIRMVTTGIDSKFMPPAGPRLTESEVETLRSWVDEGAPWPDGVERARSAAKPRSSHWAFTPVSRPAPPSVQNIAWSRNSIDAFILSKLESEGIKPSPEADKQTLIRRVSLDLIGLPPTPAQIREFLSDSRSDAYEHLVDRLLASPHYGEKWARHWLDLARYADSDGYEQDQVRPHAWRYRDWVIQALNRNMPFDQFTIEQISGDLLSDPTLDQRAATGFHRNTLTSREGGIDVEQLRDEQVMDRTNTVTTTWLGLTVECARCHDHKYDPISQKEYYQLFAFFNGAEEVNLEAPVPGETGTFLRRLPEYESKLNELIKKYRVTELQPRWESELRKAVASPEARLEWTQVVDYLRVYLDHGPDILAVSPAQRTWKQAHGIMRVFLKSPGPLASEPEIKGLKFGDAFSELEALDAEYPQLGEIPAIQQAAHPPKTYIHLRGDFRNPGIEVEPGTLGVLPPLPAGAERNRLALAKWLVSPENPLTPRVTVNRIWQELFGTGLVVTSEDFGTRGDPPSHPELLDWLASELVSSGWRLKHVQRLIVLSSTYRQSSKVRDDLSTRDPGNRLLARQSRLRLPAELIRDAALQVSGLLNPSIGGRSIRPPLPKGSLNVAYRAKWDESLGPESYRRGLYIFLQRSVPYPQLISFDAPSSLVSCSRRERSTTPLQALTLLNDPVFFEAAQALAFRILRESSGPISNRINYAYQLCLNRLPGPEEREQLSRYFEERRRKTGQTEVGGEDTNEVNAWVGFSSILLNLDEFITRE